MRKLKQTKIKYFARIIHLVNVELPSSPILLSSSVLYFLLGSQEQPLSHKVTSLHFRLPPLCLLALGADLNKIQVPRGGVTAKRRVQGVSRVPGSLSHH